MSRLLSPLQRQRIAQVIHDHHLAFVAQAFGVDAVPAEELQRATKRGVPQTWSTKKMPDHAAIAAFLLGEILAHDPQLAQNLQTTEFWKRVADTGMLSAAERDAIGVVQAKMFTVVKSVASRVEQIVMHAVHDADLHSTHTKTSTQDGAQRIKAAVKKASATAMKQLRQAIFTEIHNAMEAGRAAELMKTNPDPMVYKRPRPDACPFCKLLYLKPNGVPRVFKLSELTANGSNVGRQARRPTLRGPQATEWRPTLGAVHPWCRCQLFHMPTGFVFDERGRLVKVAMTKAEDLAEPLDKSLIDHVCIDV